MKPTQGLQSAKNACLRLLKVRPRSEKELRDRLHRKGFDDAIIEQAIAALVESGLIDDEVFARLWVESRIKRPLGMHRLASELSAKGIHKQIIEQVLAEYNNPRQEEQLIRQMVALKMKKLKGVDKKKIKERLWGFFLRRGFSRDIVFDVLHEL